MKKIICFDSWTAGSRHFIRLVKAFRALDYELLLIHIGSWGHDKNRPPEEVIESLKVRDISFYGNQSFKDILELEKPAAVLFISTRAFAHQAFNRYARSQRIPTVHLLHGLVNVQHIEKVASSAYMVNWRNQISVIARRFYKNVFVLWPVYLMSLVRTQARLSDWVNFSREVWGKVTATSPFEAPSDATTSIGCVYVKADVDFLVGGYHIDQEKVFVVGNPDLAWFGVKPVHIGMCFGRRSNESNRVIYVASALLESREAFSDASDLVNHFLDVRNELLRQGFELELKLHPATMRSFVLKEILDAGLIICSSDDFVQRLDSSCAAIVEPSSAAMIPALLGLPVFLACFGRLYRQKYGSVLLKYPARIIFSNLAEFSNCLSSLNAEREVFDEWVNDNAGPLPADQMQDRVVKAVDQMIRAG